MNAGRKGAIDKGDSMIEEEYGGVGDIRFLDPEDVKMYDMEGNLILCKCGKSAGSGAIGKESFVAWCRDCSPLNQATAGFVYRPPKE